MDILSGAKPPTADVGKVESGRGEGEGRWAEVQIRRVEERSDGQPSQMDSDMFK